MSRRNWIILISLFIVIVGTIIYFTTKKPSEEEEEDKYAHLETRTITNKLYISGEIASSKEVLLKSELAGIIDRLFVEVGQQVKKGAPIAKIRILPDPQNSQDAQRQVNTAKIDLDKVKADFDRFQFLYDKGVISKQEYDNAVREYRVAQETLNAAENYQRIVRQGYSNKNDFVSDVIYSTIDGEVLDLPVKIGASITNRNTFNDGTTVATIADMSEVLFKGKVSESALKYLNEGKELNVKINAIEGPDYKAYITNISPKGIDEGGIIKFEIQAKIEVKSTDLYKIKSGFSAVADFLLEEAPNATVIEDKYIQYNQDTAFVYVANPATKDDKVKKVVTTGISDGQYTQILSGLKKEDNIIKESM